MRSLSSAGLTLRQRTESQFTPSDPLLKKNRKQSKLVHKRKSLIPSPLIDLSLQLIVFLLFSLCTRLINKHLWLKDLI